MFAFAGNIAHEALLVCEVAAQGHTRNARRLA